MQGDSIKNIDWKVFGRREKYFVKEYLEETNLISNIIVDISKSMSFASDGIMSKYEYALTLTAALSYIMVSQQDSVGIVQYSDVIQNILPPKSTRVHLKNIMSVLGSIKPSGKTNTAACLNNIAEKIKKRGLIILVSDFFDDKDEVLKAIKHFHFRNNEVIVFQILDPAEISFSFGPDAVFEDMETGEEISTQPYHIRKAYEEAMLDFTNGIKSECRNNRIDYHLIQTNESFDKALIAFFAKRSKMQ